MGQPDGSEGHPAGFEGQPEKEVHMDVQNFSPFDRTLSPLGAAAQKKAKPNLVSSMVLWVDYLLREAPGIMDA